jgi:hypothetical protein
MSSPDDRARLPLVDDPGAELAPMFERPQVSPVPAPNVLRLLANNPELLKRFSMFASSFTSGSSYAAARARADDPACRVAGRL